jgi:hypothetical protein
VLYNYKVNLAFLSSNMQYSAPCQGSAVVCKL